MLERARVCERVCVCVFVYVCLVCFGLVGCCNNSCLCKSEDPREMFCQVWCSNYISLFQRCWMPRRQAGHSGWPLTQKVEQRPRSGCGRHLMSRWRLSEHSFEGQAPVLRRSELRARPGNPSQDSQRRSATLDTFCCLSNEGEKERVIPYCR